MRIAWISLVAAIACEWLAKGANIRAAGAVAMGAPADVSAGSLWTIAGLFLCSLAPFLWARAVSRGERDRYRVGLVLFLIYAASLVLVV